MKKSIISNEIILTCVFFLASFAFGPTKEHGTMPVEDLSKTESESIVQLKSRLSGFETEIGRLKGLSYVPKANDVVITTTPKAGTTWLQQVSRRSIKWRMNSSIVLSNLTLYIYEKNDF